MAQGSQVGARLVGGELEYCFICLRKVHPAIQVPYVTMAEGPGSAGLLSLEPQGFRGPPGLGLTSGTAVPGQARDTPS